MPPTTRSLPQTHASCCSLAAPPTSIRAAPPVTSLACRRLHPSPPSRQRSACLHLPLSVACFLLACPRQPLSRLSWVGRGQQCCSRGHLYASRWRIGKLRIARLLTRSRSPLARGCGKAWPTAGACRSVYRACTERVPSRRLARQACMRVLSGGWRAIVPEPSEPVTKLGSIRCQCASSAMRRASGQQAAAPAPEWALAAHPGALVPAERCRREWNGACSHHDSARVSRAAGLVWLSAGRIFVCHADGGQRRAGAQPQRTLSGKQAAAVPVGMPTSVTVRFAALLMCTAL